MLLIGHNVYVREVSNNLKCATLRVTKEWKIKAKRKRENLNKGQKKVQPRILITTVRSGTPFFNCVRTHNPDLKKLVN